MDADTLISHLLLCWFGASFMALHSWITPRGPWETMYGADGCLNLVCKYLNSCAISQTSLSYLCVISGSFLEISAPFPLSSRSHSPCFMTEPAPVGLQDAICSMQLGADRARLFYTLLGLGTGGVGPVSEIVLLRKWGLHGIQVGMSQLFHVHVPGSILGTCSW